MQGMMVQILVFQPALASSKIESFEINNQQISRKSLSSQYGVDFDLSQKIFLFFSKQSKTIKTYNQNDLFAIIAGIITFAPDRRYNQSQHAQNGKFELFGHHVGSVPCMLTA